MPSKTIKYIKFLSFFFLLVFAIFLIACSKSDKSNYKVEGVFSGLGNRPIYVVKTFSLDSINVDTIATDNGKFQFKGFVNSPAIVDIFYSDSFPPIRFVVDKDYSVTLDKQVNSLVGVNIKGGKINEELNNFKKQNKAILTSRHRAFEKNEHTNTLNELKNIDFQLSRSVRDYVSQNPSKISSVILMDEFSKGNLAPELLHNDLSLLQGEASDFFLTKSLRKYCQKIMASSVGQLAPPIELKSTKGKMVNLDSYRGDNVLLIFDMKEAPSNKTYFDKLKETHKALKNKVKFLAIVIDENIENPDTATIRVADGLDWTVLLDSQKWNSKVALKYNITTLPYMILISPEGKILDRDVSLDSLRNSFENIDLKK